MAVTRGPGGGRYGPLVVDPDPPATRRSRASGVVAAVLAVTAVVLVVVGTRGGLDQPPDGVTYLGVATNLADGRGATSPFVAVIDPYAPRRALGFDGEVPVLGWPPLYPASLAPAVALGVEPLEAARWLGAVAAGAVAALTAVLVARLVGRGTRAAPWAAGAAVGLVVVQPWFARLHAVVASEPLFLALVLAALALGAHALAEPDRSPPDRRTVPPVLAAAFVLGTVASGVRFAGVAVVVALALATALVGPGRPARRAALAGGLGALALLPSLAWSRWVEAEAGAPLRDVAWHPPGRTAWEGVASALTAWVVPPDAPTAARVVAVALAATAVAGGAWGWFRAVHERRAPATARPWLVLVAAWSATYLGVVVATTALVDRMVPLNGRLLLPLLAPLVVTVVAGLVWLVRLAAPPRARLPLATGAAVVVVAVVVGQAGTWRDLLADGRGFDVDPTTTASARLVADLDAPVLAANDPALVWRVTGRRVLALPQAVRGATGEPNPTVDEELRELGEVLAEEDGVAVVHVSAAFANPGVVGVDRLVRDAGLEVVASTDEVTVLAPTAR